MATLCEGYEVNCCAVALRSTDRQGKGIASRAMRREGMAEKSADVICEGKVIHRNDSLRQGFASDALAWKREEMPRVAQRWHGKERSGVAMAQQRKDILLKGVNDLNGLQIFSSPEFGDIRTVKEDTAHE